MFPAGIPVINSASAGLICNDWFNSSNPFTFFFMNSWSIRSSVIIIRAIASARAPSVPGFGQKSMSALSAVGVRKGSITIILQPFSFAPAINATSCILVSAGFLPHIIIVLAFSRSHGTLCFTDPKVSLTASSPAGQQRLPYVIVVPPNDFQNEYPISFVSPDIPLPLYQRMLCEPYFSLIDPSLVQMISRASSMLISLNFPDEVL